MAPRCPLRDKDLGLSFFRAAGARLHDPAYLRKRRAGRCGVRIPPLGSAPDARHLVAKVASLCINGQDAQLPSARPYLISDLQFSRALAVQQDSNRTGARP